MRPPRVGWILFFMLLVGGLLAAVLWTLTGRLWIAIPAGVVGGYFGVIVFNGTVGSGGRRAGQGPLDRGFVQMELMLLIGLVGIGAAIGVPSLVKLLRHQPMSGGNWAALIIGGLMALVGVAPFVAAIVAGAFDKPRKP